MSGLESRSARQSTVIEGLDDAAIACADADCRELSWEEIVHVSDFHAAEAAMCQAKLAGEEEGFESRIFNTFKAIGLRSVSYLEEAGSVSDAVGRCMRESRDEGDWVGEFLRSSDLGVRVQTASRSVTWLTRTLDVLGRESLANVGTDRKVEWRYPGRGLRLSGKIDLVVGTASATTPHVVVPSRSAASEAKVAFLAMLWGLTRPTMPSEIVLLVHSTGERVALSPGELFLDGVEHARSAVLARARRGNGPGELRRTPSYFTCRSCAWHDDCEARRAAESMPAARGGIRLEPS